MYKITLQRVHGTNCFVVLFSDTHLCSIHFALEILEEITLLKSFYTQWKFLSKNPTVQTEITCKNKLGYRLRKQTCFAYTLIQKKIALENCFLLYYFANNLHISWTNCIDEHVYSFPCIEIHFYGCTICEGTS